jgi:hypothetical protein
MFLLVYLEHELIVMELALGYLWPETIEELVHYKGLSTSRISPEIDAFQSRDVFVLVFAQQSL